VDDNCPVGTGETFKLGVEIIRGPDDGYILAQTSVFYGNAITYDFSPATADEIVWPDCEAATALKSQIDQRIPRPAPGGPPINTEELVSHGCLTGLLPPQPPSDFVGLFLEIALTCSSQDSDNMIELLPYVPPPLPDGTIAGTSGTQFTTPGALQIIPKVNELSIFCGTPPTPTPTLTRTPGGPTDTPTATPTPTVTPSPTVTPTATFVSLIACGDVNGDRRVNAEDALWVLWLSTNMIQFLPFPGDVDGDGVTGPLDALFILWIELGMYRCT